MPNEAYSWPEATITVVPSDNRAPFVLGYAQGMNADRTFVRDVLGNVTRAKDKLTIETVWVDDEAFAYLQKPAISDWIVEWKNSDGRTFLERWEAVEVGAVHKGGSLDDNIIRLSIEAEGEPDIA